MGTSGIKPNTNQPDLMHSKRNNTLNSSICTEEDIRLPNTHNKKFKPLKHIGKGAFGEVYLVKGVEDNKYNMNLNSISSANFSNSQYFAMKIIDKEHIKDDKHHDHLNSEKTVLSSIKHPFILNSIEAYESKHKYYIVMEFMSGGSLKSLLQTKRRMSQENSKFYLSEILLALGHLHKSGYIYRDLKPENILIDSSGHIRLADFGLAKKLNIEEDGEESERTNTFGGTPEYLAPEIINRDEYSVSVDFWSFGVLIYMMLSGIHPFASLKKTKKEMLEDISNKPVEMLDVFSEDAKDLLSSLLDLNPIKRLGMKIDDIDVIKNHQFFGDIKWDGVENKELGPPFIPELAHEYDTSYMDRKYTAMSVNSNMFSSTIVLDDIL